MAEDFGEAAFIQSAHDQGNKKSLLACQSQNFVAHFYVFQRNKVKRMANGTITTYFQCRRCTEIDDGPKARVSVLEGRVTKNPDGGHHPLCDPLDHASVEALRLKREIINSVRRGGVRPLQAYRQGLAEIPRRFPNQEVQEAVEIAVPAYKRIRSSMYRAMAKNIVPVSDINSLPVQYQLTLRGREAPNESPLAGERMLLYNTKNIVIFSSELDLEILHDSEFWICDGTFEIVPVEFAQLYTIHGFCNGEAVPCCHALLPNKNRNSYNVLFTTVKNEILNRQGNIGSLRTVVLDFEIAALEAVRSVLAVQTRGCIFHFAQALFRRVQSEGFLEAYQNIQAVQTWIKLIKALALLPPDLITMAWHQWLVNVPQTDDHLLQQKFHLFATYFRETWLYGPFETAWNHFTNDWSVSQAGWQGQLRQPGPRTTNHAEGWHSRLNHDFGHPHPALNKFLHWLQEAHHATQVRVRQLKSGDPPRPRNPIFERIDLNIAQRKARFAEERFMVALQEPQHILNVCDEFLQYMAHKL